MYSVCEMTVYIQNEVHPAIGPTSHFWTKSIILQINYKIYSFYTKQNTSKFKNNPISYL